MSWLKDLETAALADNNIKRLITKKGNRIQIGENAGEEAIVMATPTSTRITLTESSQSTKGRSLVMELMMTLTR